MSEKKSQVRCGICNVDVEDWEEHTKSEQHQKYVKDPKLMANLYAQSQANTYRNMMGIRPVRVIPSDQIKKFDLGLAYAVIEMYDTGTIDQRKFVEACNFVLEYLRKKYGKEDFRFREMFSHMQGDAWKNTFEIRALVHCEDIGCPHSTIEECDKYKNNIEMKYLKGEKCQHCDYLEGRKKKWGRKDNHG